MPENPESDTSRERNLRQLAVFATISFELVAGTAVGIGAGYLATRHWGFPWWTIVVTTCAALTAVMYRLFLTLKREARESREAREPNEK